MQLNKQNQKLIDNARAELRSHLSGAPSERLASYARTIAKAHGKADVMQQLAIEQAICDDGTREAFTVTDGAVLAVADAPVQA